MRRLGDRPRSQETTNQHGRGLALTETEKRPFLQVVRGDATPEEVAALVAVIASMSGVTAPAEPKPRSTWARPRSTDAHDAPPRPRRLAGVRPAALTCAPTPTPYAFSASATPTPTALRVTTRSTCGSGPDVRWTGRLQRLLGDGYEVVEEGLNGRTTDVDYVDRPHCNGRTYFPAALLSHDPLDVVVVMLGSNDFKTCFERSAATIAQRLARVRRRRRDLRHRPARPHAGSAAAQPDTARRRHHGVRRPDRQRLRRQQSGRFAWPGRGDRRVADDRGVLFADAGSVARPVATASTSPSTPTSPSPGWSPTVIRKRCRRWLDPYDVPGSTDAHAAGPRRARGRARPSCDPGPRASRGPRVWCSCLGRRTHPSRHSSTKVRDSRGAR